jgi:hypothetical protein
VQRFFQSKSETKPAELRTPEELSATTPGRQEFADAWQSFIEVGLPLRTDEETAWQHYTERRVRYEPALKFLGALLMTPPTIE